jgi:hypothetical protein
MKKPMEVIKTKREDKKSGGGVEKQSELLKAVKEDLERLDVSKRRMIRRIMVAMRMRTMETWRWGKRGRGW